MKCSRCSQVATTKYRGKWMCSRCREAKEAEVRAKSETGNLLYLIGEADTIEELKNATLNMFKYLTGE